MSFLISKNSKVIAKKQMSEIYQQITKDTILLHSSKYQRTMLNDDNYIEPIISRFVSIEQDEKSANEEKFDKETQTIPDFEFKYEKEQLPTPDNKEIQLSPQKIENEQPNSSKTDKPRTLNPKAKDFTPLFSMQTVPSENYQVEQFPKNDNELASSELTSNVLTSFTYPLSSQPLSQSNEFMMPSITQQNIFQTSEKSEDSRRNVFQPSKQFSITHLYLSPSSGFSSLLDQSNYEVFVSHNSLPGSLLELQKDITERLSLRSLFRRCLQQLLSKPMGERMYQKEMMKFANQLSFTWNQIAEKTAAVEELWEEIEWKGNGNELLEEVMTELLLVIVVQSQTQICNKTEAAFNFAYFISPLLQKWQLFQELFLGCLAHFCPASLIVNEMTLQQLGLKQEYSVADEMASEQRIRKKRQLLEQKGGSAMDLEDEADRAAIFEQSAKSAEFVGETEMGVREDIIPLLPEVIPLKQLKIRAAGKSVVDVYRDPVAEESMKGLMDLLGALYHTRFLKFRNHTSFNQNDLHVFVEHCFELSPSANTAPCIVSFIALVESCLLREETDRKRFYKCLISHQESFAAALEEAHHPSATKFNNICELAKKGKIFMSPPHIG